MYWVPGYGGQRMSGFNPTEVFVTERQRELLAGVCLRYHGAVEIDAQHVLDICESVRLGMMEVDDGAIFISEDWWSRLSDLDTRGLALAITAGMEEPPEFPEGTVSAGNVSGQVM